MKKINFLFFFFVFLISSSTYSQSSKYTQYGDVSLVVKFKNHEANIQLSSASIHNPILEGIMTPFEKIDQQTYVLKIKSFGPTSFFFMLNMIEPLHAVLFPGEQDTLFLSFDQENNLIKDYKGINRSLTLYSKEISEMLMDVHNLGNGGVDVEKGKMNISPFKSANDYRDHYIQYINSRICAVKRKDLSPAVNNFFAQYVRNTLKSLYLTRNYRKAIENYNNRIGLDSIQVLKYIPERKKEYFNSIIGIETIDTLKLIAPGYAYLLQDLRNDSQFPLPNILEVPLSKYKESLNDYFDSNFNTKDNIFYDFMIAGALIDKIYQGNKLSQTKVEEISSFFANKSLSAYVLGVNGVFVNSPKENAHHLPYSNQLGENVLDSILSKYKSKTVVIDFWATWCGPCIDAFAKIKEVKNRYQNRQDIVFVYLTNETSDFKIWKDFTRTIEGEHYYLSNSQMKDIYKKFGINSIPYYSVVNGNGLVISKSDNKGYMGNEILQQWIEESLKSSDQE